MSRLLSARVARLDVDRVAAVDTGDVVGPVRSGLALRRRRRSVPLSSRTSGALGVAVHEGGTTADLAADQYLRRGNGVRTARWRQRPTNPLETVSGLADMGDWLTALAVDPDHVPTLVEAVGEFSAIARALEERGRSPQGNWAGNRSAGGIHETSCDLGANTNATAS